METPAISFPTYRLRDVNETVESYDRHFWKNGHSVRIVVFDDSISANQEKYFPLREKTHPHNELYYVGPREKEQFLNYLNGQHLYVLVNFRLMGPNKTRASDRGSPWLTAETLSEPICDVQEVV